MGMHFYGVNELAQGLAGKIQGSLSNGINWGWL